MRRRYLLTAIPTLLACPALAQTAAQAAPWPNRPVRLINPFSAGSAVDVVSRLIAADIGERLGTPVLVENRTGASGNIGTEAAARAPADGTTVLVGSPGTMAINPFLFARLPYDAVRDFVPVSHAVSFPQVMVVNPQSPYRSLADVIAAAKARPGELNYGSSGNGTTSHLAMELLRAAAGIDMVNVPFRGGSQAVEAVIKNDVHVAVEGLPSLPGFLSNGQLRALAVTSRERAALIPDVPAISETVPGFDASAWIIYFAPAGTPAPMVERLSAEIASSLQRPNVRERLEAQGATIVGADPARTMAFHRAELEKWQRAVQLSGARVD